MNLVLKNRTLILFTILCVLALAYSYFEYSTYSRVPASEQQSQLATEAVLEGEAQFQQLLTSFTTNSNLFANSVSQRIKEGDPADQIFSGELKSFEFWGAAVYRDRELYVWDGFVPADYPGDLLTANESAYISLESDNNVTYLFSVIPFFIQEDTATVRYDAHTRVKISQNNILALGKDLELDTEELFDIPTRYPVHFSFADIPIFDVIAATSISTNNEDSVGTIYATASDFETYQDRTSDQVNIWRAMFLLSFLFIAGLLVLSFSESVGGWAGLMIQVGAFTTVWLLLKSIYPLIDIQNPELQFLSNIQLVEYIVNSIFALLIAISITTFLIPLRNKARIQGGWKNFFIPLAIALFSSLIFRQFLFNTSDVVAYSGIRVMDLELLPSLQTSVFYLSSSVFFASLATGFITVFWFIFKASTEKILLPLSGFTTGFIAFILFIEKTLNTSGSEQEWALVIIVLFFALAIVFSIYLVKRTPVFMYTSKLRLLIFFSYLAVCFIYISYSNGNINRQNQRMMDAADYFSVDEENEIQEITTTLLLELSGALTSSSENVFNDTFFDQFVKDYIRPEWLKYTISVQLINSEGNRFADYTTSLSPPQWSTAFRIQELEFPYIDEQIRRENLRPILRTRPINTLNSSYSTFMRGWIPLFESEESDERIGWILCSVYRELPQLDRPLRTVISTREEASWEQTLTVTEYEGGVTERSTITGIPLDIPSPSILSDNMIEQVNRDSIVTNSIEYGNSEIRELYVKKPDGKIVRVATRKYSVTQHVFSFLRLLFLLIILGIFALIITSYKENWQIFGHSRKFKDRLLDRFILASILCLLALIGASYYVLNAQNNDDVRDRLFDRLSNLTTNIQNESDLNIEDPAILQQITSILDVDAALYRDGKLVNSTTSQIFSQNVLPRLMPWDAYNSIINREQSRTISYVNLDEQEMMIGYMPWIDENNEIAGIAAIPTFIKAPKFYDRLLSTTSYLLAFYTLIFGLLMLGVAFISTQLTAPLEDLQEGLKKISDGDLETTLPVNSDDEIGTLTTAYNIMAQRLKQVQKELAESEREAAWKEMARQVAHEIKNPLTPMKLNLQHLERQIQATGNDLNSVKPKISKIAGSMIEQIDSLNKIASDFSKFAKPIEQEKSALDLNEVFKSVIEMYDTDDSFALISDVSEEPLPVMGVKEELRRVLINLIKNAKEALDEAGTVTVSSFRNSDSTDAFITVTDNGDGISEEDQGRIFVPNFSTKSSGTGLGLAISRKIIEEHDGEITFISTRGQGSSFTIRIPLKK